MIGLVALYRQRKSFRAIGAALGVPEATVAGWIGRAAPGDVEREPPSGAVEVAAGGHRWQVAGRLGGAGMSAGSRTITGHRVGEWHGRAKYPDTTVAAARALHRQGLGYHRIGQALGVPWRTVADWIRYDKR